MSKKTKKGQPADPSNEPPNFAFDDLPLFTDSSASPKSDLESESLLEPQSGVPAPDARPSIAKDIQIQGGVNMSAAKGGCGKAGSTHKLYGEGKRSHTSGVSNFKS